VGGAVALAGAGLGLNWAISNFRVSLFHEGTAPPMMSTPVIIGAALLVVGLYYVRQGQNAFSVIHKATVAARVDALMGRSGMRSQSIENINAGGDVVIRQQIADANRNLENLTGSFWGGPFGAIANVVAIVAAAIVTKLTGLTH
jgi:hypothetical protein